MPVCTVLHGLDLRHHMPEALPGFELFGDRCCGHFHWGMQHVGHFAQISHTVVHFPTLAHMLKQLVLEMVRSLSLLFGRERVIKWLRRALGDGRRGTGSRGNVCQ